MFFPQPRSQEWLLNNGTHRTLRTERSTSSQERLVPSTGRGHQHFIKPLLVSRGRAQSLVTGGLCPESLFKPQLCLCWRNPRNSNGHNDSNQITITLFLSQCAARQTIPLRLFCPQQYIRGTQHKRTLRQARVPSGDIPGALEILTERRCKTLCDSYYCNESTRHPTLQFRAKSEGEVYCPATLGALLLHGRAGNSEGNSALLKVQAHEHADFINSTLCLQCVSQTVNEPNLLELGLPVHLRLGMGLSFSLTHSKPKYFGPLL